MKFNNAKKLPIRLYGLHMCEGVAEYKDEISSEPYRILIGEECLKQMDSTFDGKPVYVRHVDEVDLEKLQEEAAGYVVRSFYNPVDGKHWAEFLVVSDAGHQAISAGWKLSNAYLPKEFSGGGKWHNVEYLKEVTRGEYEHLAIVPNPRYEESIVLTPEEFKNYNTDKEAELKKIANSRGESSMLKLFKRTKVENAVDYENVVVALKTGSEKTISQLVNEAEEQEEKKKNEEKEKAEGKMPMANGDHMVKVGENEMSVNALVEKYNELVEKKKDDNEDTEENEEPLDKAKKEVEEKKEHSEDGAEDVKKHEDKEELKKGVKKNSEHFDAIKNAPFTAKETTIDLSENKLARGKARYGSN